MIYNKSVSISGLYNHHVCRKDRHHLFKGAKENDWSLYMWAFVTKKDYRKFANGKVRRYKGEISNGGFYKQIDPFSYNVL